ncbi:MAG: hypothetical protein LBR86_03615, partial [Tannerella sp.]|nr:hypothetical protein [Tannerella sp.]
YLGVVEALTSPIPPLGVGSAYVGLKACLQTCRKRGRLLLIRRRLEPSPSEVRNSPEMCCRCIWIPVFLAMSFLRIIS